MHYATTYPSPVGLLTLTSDGKCLTGLWIEGQKYFGETAPDTVVSQSDIPLFHAANDWLDRYFAGKKPAANELPLRPSGSEFRREVWGILCDIPYGSVITYGDIAKKMAAKMGRPHMSAQAVGGAVGHNPISIIIPCHRVVGANGSLTGYAGGIDVKWKLLAREGVDTTRLSVPKSGAAL